MTDIGVEGNNTTQGTLAIAAAVLLGMAAVLTAWSAYRASLTSDLVLKNYSEQQAATALANDAYIRSGQERQQELTLFVDAAVEANKEEGSAVVFNYLTQGIMSKELYAAFKWWQEEPEKTTPPTPFVPENPEFENLPSEVLLAEGQANDEKAEVSRVAAEKADADSDRFDLANVFFAVVLFVAGLTTIVQRRSIQIGFLALSVVGLVAGFIVLATTSGAFALG
ncbi:MAG: hypothetical protein ACKOQ0_00620 [Solirubrobacterales bacterium]